MECYYHPERESTDTCAICGKSVCKECGLKIAGKVYCKDCLEKIVGLGLNNAPQEQSEIKNEPARLEKEYGSDSPYQVQEEVEPITPEHYPIYNRDGYLVENKAISDDSPYNIKSNIDYNGGIESSYSPEPVEIKKEPQFAQNEFDRSKEVPQQTPQDEFIYPNETQSSSGLDLEDKYEKYLNDLYFDENEVPLEEQLAKDEEQYGSLTRKPYKPRREKEATEINDKKLRPRTQEEELEARIRAEIAKEMAGEGKTIHNLNYQQEKEPLSPVDIVLTIILIIVILIVVYYLIYLILLSSSYPTFMDAVFALSNPQNVVNNLLK